MTPADTVFGLAPLDASNERLLENVHPPDWHNPSPRPRYDLVVIGAGTGGLVTAAIAAGLGARVALIERHLMGGDCLTVGCVPSKALLHAARTGVPFAAAMARVRAVRADLSALDSASRFADLGVDVFFGEARFVDRATVAVGDARLRFRRAVIATGARPAVPAIPGLAALDYLTNETVFNLTTLPPRLVVIGAGSIGCELAQAFVRFGSHVTVVDQAPTILPRDDPDAAAVVERAMRRNGVQFVLGVTALRAARAGGGLVVDVTGGRQVEADAILVAAGRTPNIERLGLDVAGVKADPARGVIVDDRLRTSNRAVFAVGDVCSSLQFTHHADAQARLVIPNALFFGLRGGRARDLVVPWCTYTTPELAHVGHTPASAREAGIAIDTITVPLTSVDRAVLDDATDGFARVHVRRGADRIVGATFVAEHAGESIGEITVAMTNGVGLAGIGRTIHPYPTQAEAFRKAADAWQRQRFTPRAKRIFERFFALFR